MTKQKVGLVLFWLAVIWAFLWGVLGSVFVDSAFKNLTMDEVNQTMWATTGPWYLLWAFGVPLGALVAGIGVLLYSGAKGLTMWKCGIGIVLGVFIGMASGFLGHIPPLFGTQAGCSQCRQWKGRMAISPTCPSMTFACS